MLDYLRWRGDLTINRAPFGEVDGLILSQLAYLSWEKGLAAGETAELRALWPRMRGADCARSVTGAEDVKLFRLAAESARFGQVRVSAFARRLEEGEGVQFAALCFELADASRFVAFRGTDGTLVGWKEDFNMAFSSPVPAQRLAADYLRYIAALDDAPLRLGGHSKGGNLAMYAAAMADEPIRKRIVDICNYDGPGLSDRMDAAGMYARLEGRLRVFVPKASLIGMLLDHPDAYTVVDSDGIGIMQHNPYHWRVLGARFVTLPGLDRESLFLEGVLRRWLQGLDEGERRLLIDALFDVIQATGAERFGRDVLSGLVRNPGAVAGVIQGMRPQSRLALLRMLGELGAAALKRPGNAGTGAPPSPGEEIGGTEDQGRSGSPEG